MGDVPFEDELETLVGNQFFPKHVAFFNCPSNTTFYSNSNRRASVVPPGIAGLRANRLPPLTRHKKRPQFGNLAVVMGSSGQREPARIVIFVLAAATRQRNLL